MAITVMSITGNNHGRHHAVTGFTLFELLVVLALVALIFTFSLPRMTEVFSLFDRQRIVKDIVAAMKDTRTHALRFQQPAEFSIDTEGHYYQTTASSERHEIPHKVDIKLVTARSLITQNRAAFRFFADGSASGGKLTLSFDDEVHVIQVNWLTGQISRAVSTRASGI